MVAKMQRTSTPDRTAIIVGGGLVGALQACFLAQRGFEVEVYERRPDIRKEERVRGRSINLALSCRGRSALNAVGLEDVVVQTGIPMYARMIHDPDGTRRPIPYGTKEQYIMSVDRRKLNEVLLSEAEKHSKVKLFFEHKLIKLDPEKPEATFLDSQGREVHARGRLLFGCDGAFSSVRQQLMKTTRFDFAQEYIPHGYMELKMPAVGPQGDQFPMETNYLHIWPRHTFMMIGLPNTEDASFVLTLFMPFEKFEEVDTKDKLMQFFRTTFPDSIPLIGQDLLVSDYMSSKPLPMVSVKCSPYHYKDKVVILGDAAHAMVPFYGQGMNCGFEDCLVFDELMDKLNENLGHILKQYTIIRNPDAKAMCDLAKYNYVEMRSMVNSQLFLLRKRLDNTLHWLLPRTWIPLYTMVSFSRIRYHECIDKRKWQDQLLNKVLMSSAALSVGCASLAVWFAVKKGNFEINIPKTFTIFNHTFSW